ncbi:hypothetical protein GALL_226330 [mine drainage metagenome]|uniref:DUF2946 domain-containing protein n=1 Tax=mine drainage metagenome TaxID=410659 RepID=A0A1J5S4V9_9ZZZZ
MNIGGISTALAARLGIRKGAWRQGVYYALFATLLINIVAAALLPLRAVNTAGDGVLAAVYEDCSLSHGPTLPGHVPGPPSHGLHCLFCLPLLHGSLIAPDAVAALAPPAVRHETVRITPRRQIILPPPPRSPAAPRAPPIA